MKRKISVIPAFCLFLAICLCAPAFCAEAEGNIRPWTVGEVRKAFEHNMLPRYFYDQPDNVMSVLEDAGMYLLWESVATENGVDVTYSEEDYAERLYQCGNSVELLQVCLPDPEENLLCFRIYFLYVPGTDVAGYYTVEYDNLLYDTSCLCLWRETGEHVNYGELGLLDKNDPGYEDALRAEAEGILSLAGFQTEITSEQVLNTGSSSEDPGNAEPEPGNTENTEPAPVDLGNTGSDIVGGLETPADTAGLSEIRCDEQGFSFFADPAYSWNYEEGTGVTVYTEHDGVIPYVIVFQSEDLIMEPYEYIREQYTPHMQNKYGDDLISLEEYEDFEVGGRQLPAGVYTVQIQGYLVDMIRIYDSTGPRTVAYTAKYIQGDADATMAALDAAVKTFDSDFDEEPSAFPTAEPEPAGNTEPEPSPNAEPEPSSDAEAMMYTDDVLNDGTLVYYFEDLALYLPASWRGLLRVNAGPSGVSFYQKASYEKYLEEGIEGGGFLFGLGACVNDSFTDLPSYDYLGFSERSFMNYYLEYPTDYPAYMQDDIRAEYDQMREEIGFVKANAVIFPPFE